MNAVQLTAGELIHRLEKLPPEAVVCLQGASAIVPAVATCVAAREEIGQGADGLAVVINSAASLDEIPA